MKHIETISEGEEQGDEDDLDDHENPEPLVLEDEVEDSEIHTQLDTRQIDSDRIEHVRPKSREPIKSNLNGWGHDLQKAGEGLLSGQHKEMGDTLGRTSPTKSDRTLSSLSSNSVTSSQGRRALRNPFRTPKDSTGGSSIGSASPELDPEKQETFAGSARQTGAEVVVKDNTISRRMRKGRATKASVTESTFASEPPEQQQPPQRRNSLSGFLGRWMPLPGYRSSSLTSSSRPMSQIVQPTSSEAPPMAARPLSYGSASNPPQRSASDASFWARRQGANDWGAAEEHEGSGDWDVEGAIRNRVVQQMFTTVPRQTLRVVNADVDDGDDEGHEHIHGRGAETGN
jgi:hypothetical protein